MAKKKGKLIVIDGTDGSGKSTQIKYLLDRLAKDKVKTKYIHFPEYDNFIGGFIKHCLNEQYYNFVEVHPKIVSVLYAADRWESSAQIIKWLDDGYTVVLDRYVSANQIHQGGKIEDIKKRKEFLKWLDELEYKVFKIPRADITLYLSLPIEVSTNLLHERSKKAALEYGGGKQDVHEVDLEFQKNSIKSALWLSKTIPNFVKINCMGKKAIRTREDIHEEVYENVKKVLKK